MTEPAVSAEQPAATQLRAQAALDSGAALVLAMLAWPFPLARALLPVAVNVVSVIVFWQLVQVAYFVVAVGVWGRTGGMALQGLGLIAEDGGEPSRANRVKWGALAGVSALMQVAAPSAGAKPSLAERAAGVRVRAF